MVKLEDKIEILSTLDSGMADFDIETLALKLESMSAVELATFMYDLERALAPIDSIRAKMNKVYDFVRINLLPDKMDAENLDGMKITGVGRVTLTSDIYASIPDKELGYAWLKEHGHEAMITETVNASSLKALLRRRLRDGKEIPEDVFKVTPFTRASITKL